MKTWMKSAIFGLLAVISLKGFATCFETCGLIIGKSGRMCPSKAFICPSTPITPEFRAKLTHDGELFLSLLDLRSEVSAQLLDHFLICLRVSQDYREGNACLANLKILATSNLTPQ